VDVLSFSVVVIGEAGVASVARQCAWYPSLLHETPRCLYFEANPFYEFQYKDSNNKDRNRNTSKIEAEGIHTSSEA